MIQRFCDMARVKKEKLEELYAEEVDSYSDLLTIAWKTINENNHECLVEVHTIGDDDYQGQMLIVLQCDGKYYVTTVGYGSCSRCDALQACDDGKDRWTILMHLLQKMVEFD